MKKYKKHYISFYHGDRLDYPELISEGRKKFKILLIDENEDFMREVLFLFYTLYVKTKDFKLIHPLLRLYSDVISTAHSHYPEEDGYL